MNKLTRSQIYNKLNGSSKKLNYDNIDNVLKYLDDIEDFIRKYEYLSSDNYELCGRKKILDEEIRKKFDNKEDISLILGLLEEYICYDNIIYPKVDDLLNQRNDNYIKEEYICYQEKENILKLIFYIKKNIIPISYEVDKIIKKIKTIPKGEIFTIKDLIDKKYDNKILMEIYYLFKEKSKEENIELEPFDSDQFFGLPFNALFQKK